MGMTDRWQRRVAEKGRESGMVSPIPLGNTLPLPHLDDPGPVEQEGRQKGQP